MRQRISWLVVATTSAVVVSFVIPLCLLVQTLAADRAMSAADQEARNVAILLTSVSDDEQLTDLLAGVTSDDGPSTSVLTAGGRQVGAGPRMRRDADVRRALEGEAFRLVDDGGGRVLVPVVVDGGTAVVRSTVSVDQLREGVRQAWAGIIGLGLVLLAVSVAIARRLGGRISAPLREVADTAHRLREGDLAARAEVTGTEETQELARALNGLAERTTQLLITERAAVGDLSHRLRTPVTALRLDAEAVNDPALAQRLQQHIAVLQRTIDAIVRDARRPVRTDLTAECDARATLAERLEFWAPLAEDQGRALAVTLPESDVLVGLAADDLRDLIDVIVDNVFAHTPEGTAMRVELVCDPQTRRARLSVGDDGPGLGGPEPGRLQPARTGTSGVGLDIAARTVASIGGEIRLGATTSGGALIDVELPLNSRP